jgi:hypothetical protein
MQFPFEVEMLHPPPEKTIFKKRYAEKKHLLFNTHTGHVYSTLYILVHFDLLLQWSTKILSHEEKVCF